MAKENQSEPKLDPITAFRMPDKLRADIKRVARENDRDMSAEIRQAIKAHIETHVGEKAAA